MGLKLKTAPTVGVYPITSAEVQAHLRRAWGVGETDPEQAEIDLLLPVATDICEEAQNRAYISQAWTLTARNFAELEFQDAKYGPVIRFPKAPLSRITAVRYTDPNGVAQVLASSNYEIITNSSSAHACGVMFLAEDASWPDTNGRPDNVQIDFECGFGAAATDIPKAIKAFLLQVHGYLFAHRLDEEVVMGTAQILKIPGLAMICDRYRVFERDSR